VQLQGRDLSAVLEASGGTGERAREDLERLNREGRRFSTVGGMVNAVRELHAKQTSQEN